MNRQPGERTLGEKLRVLRSVKNLTQSALARKSGINRVSISMYETDKSVPDADTLQRLLREIGFTWASLDAADEFLTFLEGCSIEAIGLQEEELDRTYAVARVLLSHLVKRKGQEERKALIREKEEYKDPLMCEVLCLESERLCTTDPQKAIELAELAVFQAGELLVEERTRAEYLSYAYAHLGNARRVQGRSLPSAESAFVAGARHWDPETSDGVAVDAGRILALKASLRISQRRLPEAWDLLEKARDRCRNQLLHARILVSMSRVREQEGEWDAAIGQLYEAEPFVNPERDPRLLLCVRHNLVWLLTYAGRHEEAQARFPELVRLCRRVGGVLDMVRLRWAEARIAAEAGKTQRAIELFNGVRGEFLSRDMGYDTALVTLDMALTYAKAGRPAEVKTLARHMVPIFHSQDVHREALAALTLFRQSAEAEKVTEEFARGVLVYLLKTRSNPELKFDSDLAAIH